jgi:hypothetical protein
MKQNAELKLDANGEVDLDYYLHKAELMRAMYIAEQFSALKSWLHTLAERVAMRLFSQHRHLPH